MRTIELSAVYQEGYEEEALFYNVNTSIAVTSNKATAKAWLHGLKNKDLAREIKPYVEIDTFTVRERKNTRDGITAFLYQGNKKVYEIELYTCQIKEV